ncbi:MAG: IPT/TIG domain-containing protein [Bryobacteraceae bacterium]
MSKGSGKRLLFTAFAAVAMSPIAGAYYHFVHYRTRSAPFTAIIEKIDLNALSGNTLPVLVAEGGPAQMAPNDSLPGVISQVRLAAKVWSDVETSALDLSFGGTFVPGAQHNSPVIEVVFQDLPPGVFGLSSLTKGDYADTGNGLFVPIQKSTVIMPRDLTTMPSWSESFFMTLTHEMGHAIGLQHTLTSSVMATHLTRATTKSKPLGTDDIIGVSLLYPRGNWLASTGTIRGRVALTGGAGAVNLASVVAISVDGAAISAMTAPDGSYQIQGVPQGLYYVYAHPLPPAIQPAENYNAGIVPPVDADGRILTASVSFDTIFYPGVKDPNRAETMVVSAGGTLDNVNFTVTRRSAPAVFGVQTYSFPGQVAVKPAHLSPDAPRSFFLANGYGLTDRAAVSVIGGAAVIPNGGVKAYTADPRYLQIDTQFNLTSGEGPRHLAVSADNDLYVLPTAFRLTRRLPPQISSISPSTDATGARVLTVTGSGFTSSTAILFDGVPAVVRRFEEGAGSFVVLPPPASGGYKAVVVALNPDGQSSLFLQGAAPPTYEYEGTDASGVTVSPSQLPAGVESMVEVLGSNANFSPNYVALMLGSAGVTVRKVWVASPNRLLANVAISANAAQTFSSVTVLNGLRYYNLSGAFQVTGARSLAASAASGGSSSFRGTVTDPNGRTEIPAGGVATVRISGPVGDLAANQVRVTVDDKPATIVSYGGGSLTFRVPAELNPGPAVLRLAPTSGADSPFPIVMVVDQPPPSITGISISGTRVDAARPARPGELVTLQVSALADAGADIATARVAVFVGQAQHAAASVTPVSGGHAVQFVLDPATPAGAQSVSISVDGRLSASVPFPVRAN